MYEVWIKQTNRSPWRLRSTHTTYHSAVYSQTFVLNHLNVEHAMIKKVTSGSNYENRA